MLDTIINRIDEPSKYRLIAQNITGAKIVYYGVSIVDSLRQFDRHYERSGFKIMVYTPAHREIQIKKTYR